IPRLDQVAAIIRYQEKHYDGGGIPRDEVRGEQIPAGARVLKAMLDFDRLLTQGRPPHEALTLMQRRSECYDPAVLEAIARQVQGTPHAIERLVPIHALSGNMVIVDDIVTQRGVLLVPKGMRASESVQAHLRRFVDSGQIDAFVKVHEAD